MNPSQYFIHRFCILAYCTKSGVQYKQNIRNYFVTCSAAAEELETSYSPQAQDAGVNSVLAELLLENRDNPVGNVALMAASPLDIKVKYIQQIEALEKTKLTPEQSDGLQTLKRILKSPSSSAKEISSLVSGMIYQKTQAAENGLAAARLVADNLIESLAGGNRERELIIDEYLNIAKEYIYSGHPNLALGLVRTIRSNSGATRVFELKPLLEYCESYLMLLSTFPTRDWKAMIVNAVKFPDAPEPLKIAVGRDLRALEKIYTACIKNDEVGSIKLDAMAFLFE